MATTKQAAARKIAAPATNTKAATKPAEPVASAPKAPRAAAAAPKPAKTPKTAKGDKAVKAKKPKLVRDSFTIPKPEYSVLDELKQRATQLARPAKKSEVLRAGIKALAALPDAAFLAALATVPTIKTGRPKLAKA
ncbi:MAG: hypothetical protein ACRECD_06760 [Burkholderiaceae bacterium]